jgi:deoxyribodipyrimidine photo-lyase
MTLFPVEAEAILKRLDQITPAAYASTRNYIDGSVTYLSPYISRGVLTTQDVFEFLKNKKYTWEQVEKLVQELAWRDFFQLVWLRLGEDINTDIKQKQHPVRNHQIPSGILNAETGIHGIDLGIKDLIETGYMHNHLRMYTASLTCNIAQNHWLIPAQWMYFHLLDADWASNACSWQWVAGSFSNKKYYANQENINRYCKTEQNNSYLDVSYEDLPNMTIPGQLMQTESVKLRTELPKTDENFKLNPHFPTLLYNWYNLDFQWHKNLVANRVLILEPDIFERYPISKKSIHFMLELAKNITGIQVFVGSFAALHQNQKTTQFIFKEHPLNNYQGQEESRKFLQPVPIKNFNSFFGYWKSIEKSLREVFETK